MDDRGLPAEASPQETSQEPIRAVAIVMEQLDNNEARIQWLFNPVPDGQELLWDHGDALAATPPASWDEKALEVARHINYLNIPQGGQFVARVQVAILDAMRWAAGSAQAKREPLTDAAVIAWLEGRAANTDTDPRWLAAKELRRMCDVPFADRRLPSTPCGTPRLSSGNCRGSACCAPTYLPGYDMRIQIWDPAFAYPGVSPIHDHPWHFYSTIVAGLLRNQRYLVSELGTNPHYMRTIKPGVDLKLLSEDTLVHLKPQPLETYGAGMVYSQRANEVHQSLPEPGCVTVIYRDRPANTPDEARVFYPQGTEWGTAKPRPATAHERDSMVGHALRLHFDKKS